MNQREESMMDSHIMRAKTLTTIKFTVTKRHVNENKTDNVMANRRLPE